MEYLYEHFDALDPKTIDLDRMFRFVAGGKIKPIVGRLAKLDDLNEVSKGRNDVCETHGEIGNFVIESV